MDICRKGILEGMVSAKALRQACLMGLGNSKEDSMVAAEWGVEDSEKNRSLRGTGERSQGGDNTRPCKTA